MFPTLLLTLCISAWIQTACQTTVLYTLYNLYTVSMYTVCNVQCVQFTLWTCTLFTVYCNVLTLHCTYKMYHSLFIVLYPLYTKVLALFLCWTVNQTKFNLIAVGKWFTFFQQILRQIKTRRQAKNAEIPFKKVSWFSFFSKLFEVVVCRHRFVKDVVTSEPVISK